MRDASVYVKISKPNDYPIMIYNIIYILCCYIYELYVAAIIPKFVLKVSFKEEKKTINIKYRRFRVDIIKRYIAKRKTCLLYMCILIYI